jgi:restriction system protein
MSKSNTKGPEFIRFFIPILESLKEIGGSGTPSEVIEFIISRLKIPQKEQDVLLKNGQSKVKNQIYWARFYLAQLGFNLFFDRS